MKRRWMTLGRPAGLFAACIVFVGLVSCTTLRITSPSGGSTTPSPVSASVSASADIEPSSFKAMLDGADVSSRFSFGSGLRSLSASLDMNSGPHTLEVEAKVWYGLYQRYDAARDAVSFTTITAPPPPAGGLALAVSPPALAVDPGTSGMLSTSITRTGAFTGDVTVSVFSNLTGGSLNPITIPAAASAANVTIPIARDRLVNFDTATVTAQGMMSGTPVSDRKTFILRIAHRPGIFRRGVVTASMPFDTATGPDVTTRVAVGRAVTSSSEARFYRYSSQMGAEIGFNAGPLVNNQSFSGAGFCPTPGGGFVIAGVGPGVAGNADYVLELRYFDDIGIRPRLDVAAFKAPAAPFVRPEVLFSYDCGVVLAIGADVTSSKQHLAQVFDLLQNRMLCTVSFNDPPASLQANLLPAANGNQMVSIAVDGNTFACPVF